MRIDDRLLGSAIAKLRKLISMTQVSLSESAGLSTIRHIEQGAKRVSVDSLNRIASALEIPAGCLAVLGTAIESAGFQSVLASQQRMVLHAFADTHHLEMDRVWARFPDLFGSEKADSAETAETISQRAEID